MGDFVKASVGTFSEELQALIDYGHDCCARIDDRIYECCRRIMEAHNEEIGSYQTALTLMYAAPLSQYDVLSNERHKAVCELRKTDFTLYTPEQFVSTLYKMLHGLLCSQANVVGAEQAVQAGDWPIQVHRAVASSGQQGTQEEPLQVENHANPFVPELRLFHSRKKYAKFVERHGGDCSEMSDAAGQMTYIDGLAAILIDCDEDWHSEAALLVHEAYHAVVAHFTALGETEPGEEVMAYAIQVVSGALFYAHEEWKQQRMEREC